MAKRKNEASWVESRLRWQINVQTEGRRRTFSDPTPGRKGKIAAEKKADDWLEENLVDENTRVEVMLDRWYAKLQLSTSYSHYHQYDKFMRNQIKPVIGQKKISRLTQNDLQNVIDVAYSGGKLAHKTLSNIRACLMSFIKYCRGEKATRLHPETLTIPAGAKKSKKTIASEDELKILFSVSDTLYNGKRSEDRFIHAYRFAVLTGMRPGELVALKNEDIIGSRIKISRSINEYNELTEGKNANAQRTYTLDSHALRVLSDQKKMLMRHKQISPYIFPARDLDHVTQSTYRKSWKRYCAANGIKGANTPYELRHTFVSINSEMPSALKKLVVGHSKNMDTDGIYSHEKAGDMATAAEYISTAFTKILGW